MAAPMNPVGHAAPAPLPIQLTPAVNVSIDNTSGILTVGTNQYNISIGNTGYNDMDQPTKTKINEFVTGLLNNLELKETLAGTRAPVGAAPISVIKISHPTQDNVVAEVTRQGAGAHRIDIADNHLYTTCLDVHRFYQQWQAQQPQPVAVPAQPQAVANPHAQPQAVVNPQAQPQAVVNPQPQPQAVVDQQQQASPLDPSIFRSLPPLPSVFPPPVILPSFENEPPLDPIGHIPELGADLDDDLNLDDN